MPYGMQLKLFHQNSTGSLKAKAYFAISSQAIFFSFYKTNATAVAQLLANSVQTLRNVHKWATALCRSTAETPNCGLLLLFCSPQKKQPPIAAREKSILQNQYNTQYFAILSQGSSEAMTSKVVQSKMSNLPLGLPLCVVCAVNPRVEIWCVGWTEQGQRLKLGYCKWTALLWDAMATGHSSQRWYCLCPRSDIKGTYGHDEGATQPHGFICSCGWLREPMCMWLIYLALPPFSPLQAH